MNHFLWLHPGEGRGPVAVQARWRNALRRNRRGWAPAFAGERLSIDPTRSLYSDEGFSLIEALVALAVLAIATVGLMRTVEAHIDSTRGVERRTAAMWVAENRLAELEAGIRPEGDNVEMMGQQWRIQVARRTTDDPEIQRVRISVFPQNESGALASLDGFVDGRRR